MFPTGFNEDNGGYDDYLEHKKPEIVEKTVKADSENKAAYKENKTVSYTHLDVYKRQW